MAKHDSSVLVIKGLSEEAHYLRVLDGAPIGYGLHDREGNIVKPNRRFCRLLGYEPEELVGHGMDLCVDGPEGREKAERLLGAFREGRFIQGEDLQVRHKEGRRLWVHVSAQPIFDEEGKMIGGHLWVVDVTNQKSLTAQLLQSQKMEAIDQLAGGIAHGFNNLLTSIVGYSELLLRRLDKKSSEYHDVKEIKKASDRATLIVQKLLLFGRKSPAQPVPFNPNERIREVVVLLESTLGGNIRVVTELDPKIGSVLLDPVQFDQVVMNLVVNARDAMPQGGTLTIRTRNVRVDRPYHRRRTDPSSGPYALVEVEDTGTGMDEDIQSRLFESFFTTKGPDKGSGLGLSVVRGVVQVAGGFIEVRSRLGKGSIFEIYIPVARGTQEEEEP
jgi:PAS domain S-box-containing protein